MLTRTQLTGLSDACRRHTVTISGGADAINCVPPGTPLGGSQFIATETLTSYDPATGIETTVTRTDGQAPVVTRSLHGVPLEQTSLDERRTMAYDAFGQNVFTLSENATTGVTNRTEYIEYDVSGNPVRWTVDYGADGVAVSTAEYDMLNREVRRTDALGHMTETAYDALGRPVSVDGDTYPLRTGYDTQGRMTSSTTRDNGATWDETQWEFDPVSGVSTAKVYADGSRISYAYTENRQRTRTTWARGAWKQHAYNDRNFVSGTTYSGTATPSVAYTYADSGKLASATLSDGTSYAYGYDDRLLNTGESVTIGGEAFSVNRTYDGFRRAQETVVVVTNVRHSAKVRLYDSEDRVCGYALTNAAGRGVSVSLAYDGSYVTNTLYTLPNGRRFSARLSREAGRRNLVTRRDYFFGGQSIYWYECGFDLLGRPTNAVDSAMLVRAYDYNNRNELVSATSGTNIFAYVYDSIGNRTSAFVNSETNSYTANNLNQYTSIFHESGVLCENHAPQYDADGNLTEDGKYSYTYDAENRLVSATPLTPFQGDLSILNTYDHRHRRILKRVKCYDNGEWVLSRVHAFAYDGNNIVLERIIYASGETHTIENFWGNDLSGSEEVAGAVGGLLAVSVDGAYCFPCYDSNGNIMRYIGEDGSIVAQFAYDPYGNVLEQLGGTAELLRIRFSTKYADSEVGIVSYLMRFYKPLNGRWLNRDPIEEQGGDNLYAFCLNNPIATFDLLGLLTSSEAFDHYKSGPDDPNDSTKRTPIRISFDEINTSEVKVADFPAVKRLLSEKKTGKHPVTWKNKNDNLPFSTSGDQSLYLGNISLKLEGTLEIKADCTWTFDGTLKCFDDLYDFNASTHRSAIGEWLTSIGRKTKGKPFYVEIRGSKNITESGTLEAKSRKWRIY